MKWPSFPGWRAFFFVAGVFVLALIVRLPASFITLALPPEIELRDVEGSFWNGRLSAVGVGGVLAQEQVFWNFQPRALLDAKLLWRIGGRLAERTSRADLTIDLRGAAFNDVDLALPLEPLAALHSDLKLAQLGTVLRITAKSLSMGSPFDVTIVAEHVFSPLLQSEFGSYRLDGKGTGEGKGDWRIATQSGVLRVAGKGSFDASQSSASGQVTLTPQSPIPGLSPMLESLPKAGNGFVVSF